MDIPNKSGTRGKLEGPYKERRYAKRQGHRRIRAAVKRSLRTGDEHDANKVKSITSWDIV
jgi:hypothetical protein